MIVTAGLTPAWQQIMRFESLRPGEVNRAVEVHACASGKVINVAVALANLGAPVAAVAPLGPPAGEAIDRELSALAVQCHWVRTKTPTRTCTTLLDDSAGLTTELVENASPLAPEELDAFAKAYARAAQKAQLAVFTGSLTPGTPPSLVASLLKLAPRPTILDVRGPELVAALAERPLLVKPNREELELTLGRPLESLDGLHRAMHELNDRGARWVVVTAGPEPAWATSGGRLYRVALPSIKPVNPIGSGDCLAAGIAWAITRGAGKSPGDLDAPPDIDSPQDMLRAIQLGMAAAVENALELLPGRISADRVLKRAESISIVPAEQS